MKYAAVSSVQSMKRSNMCHDRFSCHSFSSFRSCHVTCLVRRGLNMWTFWVLLQKEAKWEAPMLWSKNHEQYIVQKSHHADGCNLHSFHLSALSLDPPLRYTMLHFPLLDIVKQSVVGSCLPVAPGAVLITLARLNHHHHPADHSAISASEAHRRCLSPVRPAASPIWTGPTVPHLEFLQATAACIGQFKWTAGLLCVVTSFTILLERRPKAQVHHRTLNRSFVVYSK